MAKLYFRMGVMNSSKSVNLITVAHGYKERGLRAIVAKPMIDTNSTKISSRTGLELDVDWLVTNEDSITDLLENEREKHIVDCILIDEAQFLTPEQVDELFEITVFAGIPVICYGIRTDFQTHLFPGSKRLLELAHTIEELKSICKCGFKATMNARKVDGEYVKDGKIVAISGQDAEYESLCGRCYVESVGHPESIVDTFDSEPIFS